jgi:hypothetical protein
MWRVVKKKVYKHVSNSLQNLIYLLCCSRRIYFELSRLWFRLPFWASIFVWHFLCLLVIVMDTVQKSNYSETLKINFKAVLAANFFLILHFYYTNKRTNGRQPPPQPPQSVHSLPPATTQGPSPLGQTQVANLKRLILQCKYYVYIIFYIPHCMLYYCNHI